MNAIICMIFQTLIAFYTIYSDRNKDVKSLDETFWEKAFVPSTLSTSVAESSSAVLKPDTKSSSTQNSSADHVSLASGGQQGSTADPGGSTDTQPHHSADFVIAAGPKLLQPILREAILTGKSMEMLENLGRMKEALNIDSDICECVFSINIDSDICVCVFSTNIDSDICECVFSNSIDSDICVCVFSNSIDSDICEYVFSTSIDSDICEYVFSTSIDSDICVCVFSTNIDSDICEYVFSTSIDSDICECVFSTSIDSDICVCVLSTSIDSDICVCVFSTNIDSDICVCVFSIRKPVTVCNGLGHGLRRSK